MYKAFYAASAHLDFALVASFLFLSIFVGALWWVLRARPDAWDAVARLPLEDDTTSQHAEGKP